jgi:hypothetical protein
MQCFEMLRNRRRTDVEELSGNVRNADRVLRTAYFAFFSAVRFTIVLHASHILKDGCSGLIAECFKDLGKLFFLHGVPLPTPLSKITGQHGGGVQRDKRILQLGVQLMQYQIRKASKFSILWWKGSQQDRSSDAVTQSRWQCHGSDLPRVQGTPRLEKQRLNSSSSRPLQNEADQAADNTTVVGALGPLPGLPDSILLAVGGKRTFLRWSSS